ncbi:hypothetical protein [Halomarina rubra]|uniref:Transcriptional regulator n=1 Tax=Halomarina rubra TaxID=2071873 RepID=A0ABD6AWD2_9EURY|nr:hypothetical protein [Halomarina rubra]
MSQTTPAISLETTFEILSDDHRRQILQDVAEETTPAHPEITLDTLLSGRETTGSATDLELEFQHVQLPKLADEELIGWNRSRGVVYRGQAFDDVAPMLTLLEEHEEELPN